MSIQFCDYCNTYIDTDLDAEHFEECEKYYEKLNDEEYNGCGLWPDQ